MSWRGPAVRRRRGLLRALRIAAWAGAAALAAPRGGVAQSRLEDFVVTGAAAWEWYDGNFSAVTVPVVDSTDRAVAAVGEFGARGRVRLLKSPARSMDVSFDGGLRQLAAMGFELRDYAPREWVSRFGGTFQQALGEAGRLTLRTTYRWRAVEDRPPMPLFLQPGYGSLRGSGTFQLRPIQGVSFDAGLEVEWTDYEAPQLLPQLDLLDRGARGVELGALARVGDNSSVRFFSGLRWSHYERQQTLDPGDPFRRDRTVSVGARWSLDGMVLASVGVEGTANRSNSLRPEYDALSVTGELSTLLPWWELSTNLFALLTWKTYVHQTSFARLVPGEEADNASVVYVDLVRPLASNLDGVLRFGWTRAETDIGSSYYRRFGTTFLMNFRPVGL